MSRRHEISAWAALLCLLLIAALLPWPALADSTLVIPTAQPMGIDSTGTVCPNTGLVKRVVGCVSAAMLWGVNTYLLTLSTKVNEVIRLAITLAVVLYGIAVMMGRRNAIPQEGYMLIIKIGFVIMFSWNFGGFFPKVLECMNGLVNAVSTYASVSMTLNCPLSITAWDRVDCALDRLIGSILPGSDLSMGLLGFLFACIVSGPVGLIVFIMGMVFVVIMLLALAKSVYIFLSSLMAISLMVCVSPLFIPLILFKATTPYFQKWLRLFIGLALQPVVLFTYLTMLLAAFDVMVYSGPKSLYQTIAGPVAASATFRIGNYMMQSGAYEEGNKLSMAITMNARVLNNGLQGLPDMGVFGIIGTWLKSATPADINNIMNGSNAATGLPVTGVNFQTLAGLQTPPMTLNDYLVGVLMSSLTAAIVAYIFYTLLEIVPYLTTAVLGGHGVKLSMPNLGKDLEDMQNKLTARFNARRQAGEE